MLPTKPWSATSASSVVSLSSLAFASLSWVSASAASFDSFCSDATLISASFAARSFWNLTSASKSCFWAADKSFVIWSCISLRVPRMPPLRALYDLAPAACPSRALGCCRAPWASAVASLPAIPVAMSLKEPSKSKRSCCMTPRKPPPRLPARAPRTWSNAAAACFASLALPPCFCNSCTLASTVMAWSSRDRVSLTSASSSRKSSFSFSRTAVAAANASWSEEMSSPRPAMSVFNVPTSAVDFSIRLPRFSILCSAVLMAAVFSFSLVSHQHMYLL
mmetsp:Transcript_91046/g.266587  ORF Transcript_91046/g.266587 Transcript_91046/m.266587 type:complete len:277 (-) Transcript_91046:235-1065(-)